MTTITSTSLELRSRRSSLLNYFSLFSSFSTLLCCALPSVLVLLGRNNGCLAAVGDAVAGEPVAAQDMDFQHFGRIDRHEFHRHLLDRSTAPGGRSL